MQKGMEVMYKPKNKTGIIVGMLLGDACIGSDGRLQIGHSMKQKDYLLYKMEKLKFFFDVSYGERIVRNPEHQYYQIFVRTKTTKYLKFMRHLWYRPNKVISKKMIYKLDEEGLCYWYLDDGSLTFQNVNGKIDARRGYLNTQGYTYEENVLLQEMLLDKFDIRTLIHKEREYYKLYLNSTELKKLIKIIKPYCPPSMYYKICMRYCKNKIDENLCKNSCDIENCPFFIG